MEHTLAILSNRSSIHTSIGLSDSNTEKSIDFNDKQRFGQSDLLKSSFSKALAGGLELLIDWHQCGNSLALCYFAVVMELPDS